jgi:hypothetical protein
LASLVESRGRRSGHRSCPPKDFNSLDPAEAARASLVCNTTLK